MAVSDLVRRPKTVANGNGRRRGRTPDRPSNAEGLTAGARYDIALHGASLYVDKVNAQDIRRLIQPWQARTMSYNDLVPEVKFATNFMSQMLRKVRLFPAKIDPDTHEPEEIHDGPPFEAFGRIQDRAGGREELQGSYAKLKFLIGETYLTVSPDHDRGEVWECLSPNELRVQPGGIASRFRAPMLSADTYIIGNDPAHDGLGPQFAETGPDVINVYRLWRPHPAYSFLAECNMQAAVDILEELVLSTYSVHAQLKSRLNQGGILWMPDEISFTSPGNDPEEDPNSDEFQQRLTQTIMAAIADPGSAAAMAPIVARIAADWIEKIKLMKFNDSQGDLAEITQRTEMIGRFATCIELPKEVITGTADINHWGAWLIDEQTWKSYGHPAALEMASDFNSAYLQPTLREENFAGWQDIVIGIDPSEVINHPDRAKDADALYTGRAISKSVWRESKGYNDNDAMPDDELNEALGVAIRDGSLAKYGIPQVRGGAIEPKPGEVENPQGGSTAPVAPADVGADIERGAPASGPEAPAAGGGPATTASAAVTPARDHMILGAAEFAVERARELAGSKIRAMTSDRGPRDKRCADCQTAIDGVANWDVCATLGQEQLQALKVGAPDLVSGAGAAFASSLVRMGVQQEWAVELAGLVEQHAARTLCEPEPPPLPAAFAALLARLGTPLERI